MNNGQERALRLVALVIFAPGRAPIGVRMDTASRIGRDIMSATPSWQMGMAKSRGRQVTGSVRFPPSRLGLGLGPCPAKGICWLESMNTEWGASVRMPPPAG